MNTVIFGSRTIDDYPWVWWCLNYTHRHLFPITSVIEGGQRSWDQRRQLAYGADHMGRVWAIDRGIFVKTVRAKWHDARGRFIARAGPERSAKMMKEGEACVGLWDGHSSGTRQAIDLAYRHIKDHSKIVVYHYSLGAGG